MRGARVSPRELAVALLLACAWCGSDAHSQEPTPIPGGRLVFQRWCEPCHGEGPDKPGTMALQEKYKGSLPALLERRTDLSVEVIKHFVRHGVSVMAPFRKTEISDPELEALARFLARTGH
jgi:(+)-pinoresinol hydroxylase